jgi:hypothetical protein
VVGTVFFPLNCRIVGGFVAEIRHHGGYAVQWQVKVLYKTLTLVPIGCKVA